MKKLLLSSLNALGVGLLATLVSGTILVQIGELLDNQMVVMLGNIAKTFMAAGIGVSVSYALKANPLTIIATLITASIGANALILSDHSFTLAIGEPLGAYVATLATVCVGKTFSGKTKLDILIIPAISICIGGFVALFISPYISSFTAFIGAVINEATMFQPVLMGAIIALIMSYVISSPISSAALAISLNLSGLAAGAAVAGCSASMIGFAFASLHDNQLDSFISQFIGTSKIQLANALKNPLVTIPVATSAIIVGVLSTTVFKLHCNALGAGMGSSGFVGQLQTLDVMGHDAIVGILVCHFLIPAIVCRVLTSHMIRKKLIQKGDLKLEYHVN